MEEQETKVKRNNPKGANKEFPLTALSVAEAVLRIIDQAGGKIDTQALSTALNLRGGAFARKLSAIKRWGLVTGSGNLSITEIGKTIIHPMSDEELNQTRKRAFMQVPLFSELYERFKLNLPEDKTFIAILIREHEIKEDDAKTILNIYKTSIKEFLSLTGEEVKDANIPPALPQERICNKQEGKIAVLISSPMGENRLKADNKAEFKILTEKLKKLFALIEDELSD